ncbi:MAG: hypothetical protein ACT4SY_13960 [Hyphomicrobiales bacterium]
MKATLLSGFSPSQVLREPYAHLVDDAALGQPLYDKLAATFPPSQRFVKGLDRVASNQAVRIPARDIIGNPEFSAEWQDFFRYHTSQDFWNDILRVFGDAIRTAHPRLEDMAGKPLKDWCVKIRGTDAKGDVELDALFVVNTPVSRLSSVRPAHVDSEDEIFAGLLYMRPDEDKTGGGDLSLYRFKSTPAFGGHYAPLSAVTEEKCVRYAANRYVAFVNSPLSIHGVSPRPPTDAYRRYINMVALVPFKAFELPAMPLFDQFKFWLERRKTKSHGVQAGR